MNEDLLKVIHDTLLEFRREYAANRADDVSRITAIETRCRERHEIEPEKNRGHWQTIAAAVAIIVAIGTAAGSFIKSFWK